MNPPDSDDDLRQRFRELREQETAHVPTFERIRRGAVPRNHDAPLVEGFWRRLGWAPAFAAMLVMAGAWWWLGHDPESVTGMPPLVAEMDVKDKADLDFSLEDEWSTATDLLLADAEGAMATAQVHRLTREIDLLLQP